MIWQRWGGGAPMRRTLPRTPPTATGMVFAMDLTPLVTDPALDIAAFVQDAINAFAEDVRQRLGRYLP